MNTFYSQAGQDQYVLKVLNYKKRGFFLEIGSNHPIHINNTYILENKYEWSGIMVDNDNSFLELYKKHRSNSKYIINDATKIDYINYLDNMNAPTNIDYLQIDLEVVNRSTLDCLELLNNSIFDKYKFATITFEHDIYRGDHYNTREKSREIFKNRGYKLVFPDVSNNNNKFEDWYVYPDLVDMTYVNKIITNNSMNYLDILKIL
jgi:hypothetical protein